MAAKKPKVKLFELYQRHKAKLIIALVIIIIASISFELYMFFNEKIKEGDLGFELFGWSESCEGTNYTLEDKEAFCQNCSENGGEACLWPLDMMISIGKVDVTRATGGEVHCYLVIDGVNYYREKGSYYGITNSSLFTWQKLDARASHDIEFCCGIERESALTNLLSLRKKWPQACIERAVMPRCG
ncbi:MAG TPA: hypothetical protein VJ461_02135 [Candidatus Nanoarchaeia archaeon]|nr:hypothetical protein [Candidatus Nanoarchaeia archaeon]